MTGLGAKAALLQDMLGDRARDDARATALPHQPNGVVDRRDHGRSVCDIRPAGLRVELVAEIDDGQSAPKDRHRLVRLTAFDRN